MSIQLIPTIVRPRLLSIKNRWSIPGKQRSKELLSLLASAVLMCALYTSSVHVLSDATRAVGNGPVDPLVPLSMMLSTLFVMLLFSSAVNALNSLFSARDLDLLLSSPLTLNRFLAGRSIDIGISASWMLFVLGMPLLLGFGTFHGAGPAFFLGAPIICLAFFSIAVITGIIGALLFGCLIPPQRGREVAMMGFLVLALGAFFLFGDSTKVPHHYSDKMHQIAVFAHNPWMPMTHSAKALQSLTHGELLAATYSTTITLAVAASLWCLLFLLSKRCYQAAYSRAHSDRSALRINSYSAQRMSRVLLPITESARRAIITKEIKLFTRDLAHTIQLGMLLGICFVYLYNFKVLTGPKDASPTALKLWHVTLLVCNISLSYLIITSICSRFVFPSISLEGNAFWILQSAPISLKEILRAKCRCWLAPVTCMGVVIFASGAMALGAEGPLLISTCVAGAILCYGLVSLGVGMGAIFSQFEWEHSTQISSNVGSFIFMVVSMIFLALNMIPIVMMFGAYVMMPNLSESPQDVVILFGLSLSVLFALNRLLAKWALSAGVKALEQAA